MNEYDSTEVSEMHISSDEVLFSDIRKSVLSDEAPNWSEILDSVEASSIASVINSRLSINGLWNRQAKALMSVNSGLSTDNVNSGISDFLKSLNDDVDVMLPGDDEESQNRSKQAMQDNRKYALNSISESDSLRFAKTVLSMKSDSSLKEIGPDQLMQWTSDMRLQITEDFWGYVQDYREDGDLQQLKRSLDSGFARISQLAQGSILQR